MRDTEHLDQLAAALAEVGWKTRAHYDESPALLRAYLPGTPAPGEYIKVSPGPRRTRWFCTAPADGMDELVAPVNDLPFAVQQITGGVEGRKPLVRLLLSRVVEICRRVLAGGGAR